MEFTKTHRLKMENNNLWPVAENRELIVELESSTVKKIK